MAAIREYTNKIEGLNVSDRGVSATAQAARSTEMTGLDISRTIEGEARNIQEAGTAVAGVAGTLYDRHVVQPEISKGMKDAVDLDAINSKKWQAMQAADPDDREVDKKFLEGLSTDLDKFVGNFQTRDGQRWAENRAERLRASYNDRIATDMSTRASVSIKANAVATQNRASQLVYDEPALLETYVKNLDQDFRVLIANSPVPLSAGAQAQVLNLIPESKKNLVEAAVKGMAEKDPDAALRWLKDGTDSGYGPYKDVISGETRDTLIRMAEARKKGKESDDRVATEALRKKQRDVIETYSSGVLKDYVEVRPDGTTLVKPGAYKKAMDIGNLPGVKDTDISSLISQLDGISKREPPRVTNSEVYNDLSTRLFDTANPTTLDQVIKNGNSLNPRDYNQLRQQVEDLRTKPLHGEEMKAAFRAVEKQLEMNIPGLTGRDPKGAAAYSNFLREFLPQYLALSPADRAKATDLEDKSSLISRLMAKNDRTQAQKFNDFREGAMGGMGAPATTEITSITERIRRGDTKGLEPNKHPTSVVRWRDPVTGKRYTADGNEVK